MSQRCHASCGNTMRDKTRNKDILGKLGVAPGLPLKRRCKNTSYDDFVMCDIEYWCTSSASGTYQHRASLKKQSNNLRK